VDEGFKPDSKNCTKFYRCVSKEKGGYIRFEFTCGPGTAWDQNLQTCNYDYQVESCKKQPGKNSIIFYSFSFLSKHTIISNA
jgi:hypothetical protein